MEKIHRFIDEAGDMTFYGKNKKVILNTEGVSKSFMIGMLKIKENHDELRGKIYNFRDSIISNPLYNEIPSVQKRLQKSGFYFHAKDDHPEIRSKYFEFINHIDCSFEAVVGRKELQRFESQHNNDEKKFYADILSHLIKNKLKMKNKLVLNIASRDNSTSYNNLQKALEISKNRFLKTGNYDDINAHVSFNVQPYTKEPLLSIVDYFCWAVQRVFERGETRFYNFLLPKIKLVIDIWDTEKYDKNMNYYRRNNILKNRNML